jgi:hypothetical protein
MELKQESCPQRATRKTRNLWVRCKGFGQTTNVQTKLALKEAQLAQCKKSFGVSYMDLIDKGAAEDDLRSCVDASRLQLESIRNDIALLKDRKVYIRQKTLSRISRSPSGWSDTPSIRVMPSSSSALPSSGKEQPFDGTEHLPAWSRVEPQHVSIDDPWQPSAPPSKYDRKHK